MISGGSDTKGAWVSPLYPRLKELAGGAFAYQGGKWATNTNGNAILKALWATAVCERYGEHAQVKAFHQTTMK